MRTFKFYGDIAGLEVGSRFEVRTFFDATESRPSHWQSTIFRVMGGRPEFVRAEESTAGLEVLPVFAVCIDRDGNQRLVRDSTYAVPRATA